MSPRRKRLLCVILAAPVLVGLFIFGAQHLGQRPPDPFYGGVALSTHLHTVYGPEVLFRNPFRANPKDMARHQARIMATFAKVNTSRNTLTLCFHAPAGPDGRPQLRLGAEAVPLITNWLAHPPLDGWRLKAVQRLSRWFPALIADRQFIAWSFLRDYPIPINDPELALFLSGLTNQQPTIRSMAASALSRQLGAGMQVDKDYALRTLYPLSGYAASIAPEPPRSGSYIMTMYGASPRDQLLTVIEKLDPTRDLIPLYVLEMGQVPARVGAANELATRPRHPERAVPLLITNLSSTNRSVIESCSVALGAYGPQAQSALPALRTLSDHPRERIRLAASNAVVAIKAGEE